MKNVSDSGVVVSGRAVGAEDGGRDVQKSVSIVIMFRASGKVWNMLVEVPFFTYRFLDKPKDSKTKI